MTNEGDPRIFSPPLINLVCAVLLLLCVCVSLLGSFRTCCSPTPADVGFIVWDTLKSRQDPAASFQLKVRISSVQRVVFPYYSQWGTVMHTHQFVKFIPFTDLRG